VKQGIRSSALISLERIFPRIEFESHAKPHRHASSSPNWPFSLIFCLMISINLGGRSFLDACKLLVIASIATDILLLQVISTSIETGLGGTSDSDLRSYRRVLDILKFCIAIRIMSSVLI
jgi:hypothetical protein